MFSLVFYVIRRETNKKSMAPKWSVVGIKQLRREDGSLTEDESEIVQIATTYYTKLLSVGVATESVHTSRKCV